MKGLFLIFALIVTLLSFTSAVAVPTESRIMSRVRRETCNTMEEYRECDRFCRRLGLPGGACLRNKCDCDRF